jgi:hypothetical protein
MIRIAICNINFWLSKHGKATLQTPVDSIRTKKEEVKPADFEKYFFPLIINPEFLL